MPLLTEPNPVPRIYVASLTDYNAGNLHGRWIDLDATTTEDDLLEQTRAMLAESPEAKAFPQGGPAEEWAIHDYEWFGGYPVHEYDRLGLIAAIGRGVAEHGPVFGAWCADFMPNEADDIDPEDFTDRFCGVWDSFRDYADDLAGECGYYAAEESADTPYLRFDLDSFARDLRHDHAVYQFPNYGPVAVVRTS